MAEKKYIPLDAALESICENCSERSVCNGVCYDTDRIRAIPAADVMERKKGKWEKQQKDFDLCGVEYFACSLCRFECQLTYNFCPNCGADMRAEPLKGETK